MKRILRVATSATVALALAGCAADGSFAPGAGEAILGVGLATLGAAAGIAAARQPVYVVPAPVCYQTIYGPRCY
jgi:hypothetical protein